MSAGDPDTRIGITLDQAVELAARWVDVARVDALYGDTDQNFRVTDGEGRRTVLKVTRRPPEQVRDGIGLQQYLLTELRGGPDGVACQRPLATRRGRTQVGVQDGAGQDHLAWMVTYLEGELLHHQDRYDTALLEDLGRSVAALDKALMQFSHPGANRHIRWDLAHLADRRADIDTVADPQRRSLLVSQFQRVVEEVLPGLAKRPRSIIHNDGGNQHNMLIEPAGESWRVCGILDFGDAVLTHRLCGLGIAAAYATFGCEDPVEAIGRVARGYHRVLPLGARDLALVDGLARARLVQSLAISSARLHSEPDNAYLQVSAGPAWRVLELLDQQSPKTITSRVEGIVND